MGRLGYQLRSGPPFKLLCDGNGWLLNVLGRSNCGNGHDPIMLEPWSWSGVTEHSGSILHSKRTSMSSEVAYDWELILPQVFYAGWILYSVAVASIKFSVCFLYLRLFPTLWIRRCIKSIIATCTIGCTTLLFMWVTMCKPSSMAWNQKESSTCLKRGGLFEAHSIFSLCINLAIITLPMPTIWGLHMPLRRRLLIMGIFAIGLM